MHLLLKSHIIEQRALNNIGMMDGVVTSIFSKIKNDFFAIKVKPVLLNSELPYLRTSDSER